MILAINNTHITTIILLMIISIRNLPTLQPILSSTNGQMIITIIDPNTNNNQTNDNTNSGSVYNTTYVGVDNRAFNSDYNDKRITTITSLFDVLNQDLPTL